MDEKNQTACGYDYATQATPNEPVVLPTPVAEPPVTAPPAPRFSIPTGKKELIFGLFALLAGWLMFNSIFFGGGFQLGYAIFAAVGLLAVSAYLLASGCKPSAYSITLLVLDLVILGSFARGNDAFVKFVMLCFLVVSINLGLCLTAGQNRFRPEKLSSLLDVFRVATRLSTGKLPAAITGLADSTKKGGSAMKRVGAVALGACIALPLLCILIPLLMRADAAFEGLLDSLPQLNAAEIVVTFLFGIFFGFWLYLRGVGLKHSPKKEYAPAKKRKGISAITVNTALIAICVVYVVYLVSQLAYFSGAFSGFLPEEYTLAEYARRGFFEMAWICAVNLLVICLAAGVCRKKDGRAPLFTRLLCLFVGIVTLFLVASASSKMFMYIGGYGMTRLRLLTEVIMIFMGLTTLIISIWLFVPKLPYMKAVLIVALVMGAAVAWADVDTVVAKYNVEAYQSGKLKTVDVDYLGTLNYGAVPYIYQLTSDSDPQVAEDAQHALQYFFGYSGSIEDFRFWNYADMVADPYLPEPPQDEQAIDVQ